MDRFDHRTPARTNAKKIVSRRSLLVPCFSFLVSRRASRCASRDRFAAHLLRYGSVVTVSIGRGPIEAKATTPPHHAPIANCQRATRTARAFGSSDVADCGLLIDRSSISNEPIRFHADDRVITDGGAAESFSRNFLSALMYEKNCRAKPIGSCEV